jgi:hypothetical protein
MKNLASHDESPENVASTDTALIAELTAAGIPCEIQPKQVGGEVQTRVMGKAGNFVFDRRWYYWAVDGRVPLEVAKEIYALDSGKVVRVSGHCMAPTPEEWAIAYEDATGRMVVDDVEWEKGLKMFSGEHWKDTLVRWNTEHVPQSKAGASSTFVTSYHIDTQEGLNLFTSVLRKHKLIP